MGAKKGRNKRAAKRSGRGGGAKRGGSTGATPKAQRLGLLVFAVVFIVLFVVFAVAQGIGSSGVPKGDAATVSSVPDGKITEAELKRAIAQQIATKTSSGELKKAPKPGTKKYEEIQSPALGELLQAVWISGEAEERNVTVTDKQIAASLAEIKKQSFKTEAAFQKFLKESHLSPKEVNKKVELQLLAKDLQEKISNEAGPPSEAEVKAYYDENKATQFTTKATRDVRVIVNEDKGEVEAALKALEADNSPASWKKVAKKYSSDPTTAKKGGLQAGISEEFLKGAVKKAIFGSDQGEVIGPTKFEKNYLVTEVVKEHKQTVQPLKEVEPTISSQLTQTKQQEFLTEFVAEFESKWRARTVCASAFATSSCSNFKGSAHPETAEPACYEASPKKPAIECPSPVTMNAPAVPGSVTELKPKGEQLVQRPRPEGGKGAAATTEISPEAGASTEAAAQAAAEAAAAEAAEGQTGE